MDEGTRRYWSLVGNVIPQAQAKEMLSRLNARQLQDMVGGGKVGTAAAKLSARTGGVSLGLGVIMVSRRSRALSLVLEIACRNKRN